MGSVSFRTVPGQTKLAAVLDDCCLTPGDVLAANTYGSQVYIAARVKSGAVIGIVGLVTSNNGFTNVKVMDETMGPYYYAASAKVLAALSPTTSTDALAWREKCHKELARAKVDNKAVFPVGSFVRAACDMAFGSGLKVPAGSILKVYEVRRKHVIVHIPGNGLGRVLPSALIPETGTVSA